MEPGGPTRAKLVHLVDKREFTVQEIARQSGVPANTLYTIKKRKPKFVRRSTARSIERAFDALCEEWGVPEPDLVDIELASTACRALLAQGWDGEWIGSRVGVTRFTIYRAMNREHRYIKQTVSDALVRLCREVGSAQGPSRRSATIAAKRGWLPSMYDDRLV